MTDRCAFCNSIRRKTKGKASAEDARDSGQESLFTRTICLTCLKNADPELHKMVSAMLAEKQAVTKCRQKEGKF